MAYHCCKEVYEQVFLREIDFPKGNVNNPSFVCSEFYFSLLELFYSLRERDLCIIIILRIRSR